MTNETLTQETREERATRMRGETLEAIASAQVMRTRNPQHEVVLVVDDNYAQNARGLANANRSIIPAYDFETASQALNEASPNVVLTDIEFQRSLEPGTDISPEEQASLERQRVGFFRGITDKIKTRFEGREERIHELDSYASKLYRPGREIEFTKKRGNELAEELQTRGVNYGLVMVDMCQRRQIPYAVVTSINHGNVAPGLVALGVCAEQELATKLGRYKALRDNAFNSGENIHEATEQVKNLKETIGKAIFVGHAGCSRDGEKGKDLPIWQEAYQLATGKSPTDIPVESKVENPGTQRGFFSRVRDYFARE
jgi:hypothetical protein